MSSEEVEPEVESSDVPHPLNEEDLPVVSDPLASSSSTLSSSSAPPGTPSSNFSMPSILSLLSPSSSASSLVGASSSSPSPVAKRASKTSLPSTMVDPLTSTEPTPFCDLPALEGESFVFDSYEAVYIDYSIKKKVHGRIFLTNFRLIFALNAKIPEKPEAFKVYHTAPWACVWKIEKSLVKTPPTATSPPSDLYIIDIRFKDGRKLVYNITSLKDLDRIMYKLAFPENFTDLFAFYYKAGYDNSGWSVYNIFEEFLRQQLDFKKWRISDFNHDYKRAPTYPAKIIVPIDITDEDLDQASLFRSQMSRSTRFILLGVLFVVIDFIFYSLLQSPTVFTDVNAFTTLWILRYICEVALVSICIQAVKTKSSDEGKGSPNSSIKFSSSDREREHGAAATSHTATSGHSVSDDSGSPDSPSPADAHTMEDQKSTYSNKFDQNNNSA